MEKLSIESKYVLLREGVVKCLKRLPSDSQDLLRGRTDVCRVSDM